MSRNVSWRALRHNGLGTVAALALLAGQVSAHGLPPDLAFYGNYPNPAARCEAVTARETQRCVATVLRAEAACHLGAMPDDPCDAAAVDAKVNQARLTLTNRIRPHCSDQSANQLQFMNVDELLRDATNGCRGLEGTTLSAIDLPTRRGVTPVGVAQVQCTRAMGAAIIRVARSAFEIDRHTLAPIVRSLIGPAAKRSRVTRSRDRLNASAGSLARRLAPLCAAEDVTALYGLDAPAFLTTVGSLAHCATGAIYVQGEFVCPAPKCGNGIVEGDEFCDDANRTNGDTCPGDCTRAR